LFKEIVDARTLELADDRTMDNRPSQMLTFSVLCSGELKVNVFHFMRRIPLDCNEAFGELLIRYTNSTQI